MNIPKAIEILEEDKQGDYEGTELDRYDAISLGIEALKWIKAQRHFDLVGKWTALNCPYHLPGETEE